MVEININLWAQNWDDFHTFGAGFSPQHPKKKSFCLALRAITIENTIYHYFVVLCYNWREINRSIIAFPARCFFSHTKNGTQHEKHHGKSELRLKHFSKWNNKNLRKVIYQMISFYTSISCLWRLKDYSTTFRFRLRFNRMVNVRLPVSNDSEAFFLSASLAPDERNFNVCSPPSLRFLFMM